ncbi:PspA/IM30 family protein [Marinagarivorans cellulosilyticus]|uniref:Phage shock protein A n=1 Tax=Marinagarivorans cellulosilyticus TaxID=2721545 RepID=A0AAN1WFS5_9GAMM|nr:PspA/IM30 family protein [Marinagarivorans cellulosilyticus]BCD96792.1 phage shock protein A [Marinagarivorans cellulosilyticus]
MSIFKRLQATLTGSLDQAISQIENQDAVVDAILKEARQALAKSKVRLARVEQDGRAMQQELAGIEAAIDSWTQRAQRIGQNDQAKALECLRQRKAALAQKTSLLERIAQHEGVSKRLAFDVKQAEVRVTDMLNKQHLMRTRESAADALRSMNAVEQNMADDLTTTFERWEVKVAQTEILSGNEGYIQSPSTLEQEFVSEEEEHALRLELAALTGELQDIEGKNHE